VELAWFLSAGLPLWLVALLVFRQHELAELEALDLAELRREKQATGAGEALFRSEGGDALAMQVARLRLAWMQTWWVPVIGLLSGAYLLGIGLWRAMLIQRLGLWGGAWPHPAEPAACLLTLALVMLALFILSRYAAGMGRVPEWRLLRACGSFTLANALAAAGLAIAFALQIYQGSALWERGVAMVIPILMAVLGFEMLVNFVADYYRPRVPGVERRASLDSRLLALISEPGGIAQSLAEALNYQFGFRVSHTWFYQLLQRTLVPLVGVGAAALWLLSSVLVVWPNERAIIQRFGAQRDPTHPLGPGLYFKWPAPFERAHKYNVDQIQQFYVGFRTGDQPLEEPNQRAHAATVELWTDPKHSGREHFDFLISPTPGSQTESHAATQGAMNAPPAGPIGAPVHLVRLEAYVQHRVDAQNLAAYTRNAVDSEAMLRAIAWDEISRFAASTHVDALLGEAQEPGAHALRTRLNERARAVGLGLEVVRVGFAKIHPEKTVAEAFRRVVTAQLEKVAEIRKARVSENEQLSQAAGERTRAQALLDAIRAVRDWEGALSRAEADLRGAPGRVPEEALRQMDVLHEVFQAQVEAQWELRSATRRRQEIDSEFELGLGRTVAQRERAREEAAAAQRAVEATAERAEAAMRPLRESLGAAWSAPVAEALLAHKRAEVGLAFWNARLESILTGLEGDAAVMLARARTTRWQRELAAESAVARLRNERSAYEAAPVVFQQRSYMQRLADGIKDARKIFLAFRPGERVIRIDFDAKDQGQLDLTEIPAKMNP
jgi:membrane protease subunit HflK